VIRTGSDGPASVDIVVAAASATQGTDFNLIEPANGTLQWTDGETQKTVQLTIADDNTIEPTESFQLQLTNPSQGAAINPAADQITVDIIDSSDSGQIVFSQDSYQVSEADQSVMIVVERTPSPDGNGNLSGTASVTLSSQSGTAANGPDFDGDLTNSTLSWGDGEGGSRTVQIDIISDDLIEGTESFTVQLSNPAPSQLQLDDPVTVNITDSSIAQPVVLQLPEGNEFQAREGDDSTILIPVSRSGDSQSQVILPLTVGLASDSVSTADFSVSQTQLVWPAGDVSTRFITIDIIDESNLRSCQ